MPPLRERPEDVLPIVAALCGGALPPMLPRLVEALHLYPWPGNVRELRVLLERAAHTRWGAMPGSRWDLDHFPDLRQWGEARERPAEQDGAAEEVTEPGVRKDPMSLDARGLRRVLDSQRWRLFAAARALGLDRVALLRRMAELGIRGPGAKDEPAPAMIEHETTGPHPR
jgi:transcriptional regulator of aroF, aroG, tyrA and aromatic amino acid transport